jgi:hypothetical protein
MTYIYESPDSGQTVYRREFGSTRRELHHVTNPVLRQQQQRQERFRQIITQAQNDTELNSMLEKIEVYYSLKNTP